MNRIQDVREAQTKTRTVQLERSAARDELGFSIRCGANPKTGAFVCAVSDRSKAAELGVRVSSTLECLHLAQGTTCRSGMRLLRSTACRWLEWRKARPTSALHNFADHRSSKSQTPPHQRVLVAAAALQPDWIPEIVPRPARVDHEIKSCIAVPLDADGQCHVCFAAIAASG